MKLVDAAKKGVCRLRRPIWRGPESYIRIDIFSDGGIGKWLRLYDRPIQEMLGEPTPKEVICVGDEIEDWEEYTGPLDVEDA